MLGKLKRIAPIVVGILILYSCKPEEPIEFKYIKNVVVDLSAGPLLRGEAVLYNPNKTKIKIRKIKVDIYVEGKKSGEVDQKLNFMIPAEREFSIPLEVKVSLREIGLQDALQGILGGKNLEVRYKGSVKINYHGLPVGIPVDYKSEIRVKF